VPSLQSQAKPASLGREQQGLLRIEVRLDRVSSGTRPAGGRATAHLHPLPGRDGHPAVAGRLPGDGGQCRGGLRAGSRRSSRQDSSRQTRPHPGPGCCNPLAR
jgi:hypothetical protein